MCFLAGSSRWYSSCFGGDAMYGFWLYFSFSFIGWTFAGSHILSENACLKSLSVSCLICCSCFCRSCLYVFDCIGMSLYFLVGGYVFVCLFVVVVCCISFVSCFCCGLLFWLNICRSASLLQHCAPGLHGFGKCFAIIPSFIISFHPIIISSFGRFGLMRICAVVCLLFSISVSVVVPVIFIGLLFASLMS